VVASFSAIDWCPAVRPDGSAVSAKTINLALSAPTNGPILSNRIGGHNGGWLLEPTFDFGGMQYLAASVRVTCVDPFAPPGLGLTAVYEPHAIDVNP
jgi:hypothetical protein